MEEKIAELSRSLPPGKRVPLRELLDASTRTEMIAAFLAVLELCRNGKFALEERKGEIWVSNLGEKDGNA